MFKPHKGTCNECLKPRYIVVRAGLCNICNEKRKKASKSDKVKMQPKVFRRKEPTGELFLFKEMWQDALDKSGDESPKCRCCGERLGTSFNICFFSHLLSKGLYPAYRLLKENIWIICFDCHFRWHNGSRNDVRFTEKNIEYKRLQKQYNHDINNLHYDNSSHATDSLN